MKHLFYEGGPLFMGTITVVLIVMVAWAVYHFLPVLTKKEVNFAKTRAKLKHIKTIGTFGLITGILGQLIGLYEVFDLIEREGDIPSFLWMGGLKVSMITPIYGIVVFMISLLLWLTFDFIVTKKSE